MNLSEWINFYSSWNHQKTIFYIGENNYLKPAISKIMIRISRQENFHFNPKKVIKHSRSSRPEVICKKDALKLIQNSQEKSVPESLFTNTFFTKQLLTTASLIWKNPPTKNFYFNSILMHVETESVWAKLQLHPEIFPKFQKKNTLTL